MTYEEKKERLAKLRGLSLVSGSTDETVYFVWIISELEKAWAALEMYAAMGHVVSSSDYGERAREALES